tara:strand:+ start:873 stop:1154 length:282 start_codon:yes stop_codon:yes gene_type:complete
MNIEEFYDYLPKYFWIKLDGFYELENIRERSKWERTRWQTTLLLNIQIAKGKKLKPTDLIKFEWDKKETKIDYKKLKAKAEYYKEMSKHKTKK